jgi:hypothetical protein
MTEGSVMEVVTAANDIGHFVVREPHAFGVVNSLSW